MRRERIRSGSFSFVRRRAGDREYDHLDHVANAYVQRSAGQLPRSDEREIAALGSRRRV